MQSSLDKQINIALGHKYLTVKVLKGFASDLWQANRRKVLVDLKKRAMIDGIEPYGLVGKGVWTATTNWEVLSEIRERGVGI